MRSPSVDVMSTEVLDSQQRGSVAATSPAERHSTPVDGVDVLGALSPSRAGDFMTCPLLYRFRTIDKLPEPASPDAVRGTLVHKVLEDLFDLPAMERTPVRAEQMLEPSWHRLLDDEPALAEIFDGEGGVDRDRWWDTCRTVLERYFTLEDPTRLEPAERELYVEWLLDSKLLLRGFVDRVDVAPDGAVRVVDYKTGRAPGPGFEGRALFQMKFYALVLWRLRGVVPAMLQLVYLGNGELVRYVPDEHDLLATERKVQAVWEAIRRATDEQDWRPSKGPLCGWCAHKALCPSWRHSPADADGRLRAGPAQRPLRCAQRAACVRSETPIREKALVRCALTVRSLISSCRAICLLARPSRTSCSTSTSRAVSCGRPPAERAPNSALAALGWMGDSPRATARTPLSTSSGSASLSR